MRLDQPIDLSRKRSPSDSSGTPIALLEQARAMGDLIVLGSVKEAEILVEYPVSPVWKRRLGVERFLRLREKREGKRYAVLLPPAQLSPPKRKRSKDKARGEFRLIPYPETDSVGRKLGYEGAGIMAYQTLDQMHPPMVDSADLWSDAGRWPEAAREHTRSAARLVGLESDERVLDIGCGIGGPARLLVDEFGVEVYGVANAEHMLNTARKINQAKSAWRERIEVSFHDCQEPYDVSGLDIAWSMNMIYRVPDKAAMLENAARALRDGGRIMVEDWMFTPTATAEDRAAMDAHHYAGAIASVAEIEELLRAAGFDIDGQEDFGHVGRTHMQRFFVPQFNAKVRPRLEADFPDKPEDGASMADQWVEGIEATIAMYVSDRMTYCRFAGSLRG